ncbi:MAG TPA: hypothetical protein VNK82_00365 [Terriglobales bacterium]|nr:hypothetical protein [Terriglobales bacterium]
MSPQELPARQYTTTRLRSSARLLRAGLLTVLLFPPGATAVELKQETVRAFDRYVRLTEARIAGEVASDKTFLWIDTLPAERKKPAYQQVRQGQMIIERMKTLDGGQEIDVPGGIIHHWLGMVFIPGVSLQQTLALVQDYDHHDRYYKPDVIASKLRARNGNDFKVFLRFYKKKLITVVMDTEHDVHYFPLDERRVHTRSYATRIAEVADFGEPGEHEKPVDDGGGFLWRLNSYWRFEERDGGVYVQCEAISLTRDIPVLVSWLVKPFVTSVPRELLQNTLANTRAALVH